MAGSLARSFRSRPLAAHSCGGSCGIGLTPSPHSLFIPGRGTITLPPIGANRRDVKGLSRACRACQRWRRANRARATSCLGDIHCSRRRSWAGLPSIVANFDNPRADRATRRNCRCLSWLRCGGVAGTGAGCSRRQHPRPQHRRSTSARSPISRKRSASKSASCSDPDRRVSSASLLRASHNR